MHAADAPHFAQDEHFAPDAHTAPDAHASIEPPPSPMVTLADRITRTLAVARALIISGREVDLAGIEDGIGMLCAKTLDMPNGQAYAMLPALYGLRVQVDSLASALRRHAPRSASGADRGQG